MVSSCGVDASEYFCLRLPPSPMCPGKRELRNLSASPVQPVRRSGQRIANQQSEERPLDSVARLPTERIRAHRTWTSRHASRLAPFSAAALRCAAALRFWPSPKSPAANFWNGCRTGSGSNFRVSFTVHTLQTLFFFSFQVRLGPWWWSSWWGRFDPLPASSPRHRPSSGTLLPWECSSAKM